MTRAPMTLSIDERARQKAAARARDEQLMESGEFSVSELQWENCHFSFLRDRVSLFTFIPAARSKGKRRVIVMPAREDE